MSTVANLSFRSICEKFDVGRATALSAARRVIKALYDLAPNIIKWPSGNNINEVWTGFEAVSGFPKVIGAIDGIHINIPAPRVYPASYVNRKGHHSIQLQVCHVCCDMQILLLITNLNKCKFYLH